MKHKGVLESVKNQTYFRLMRCVRFFGERFTVKQYSPPGIDSSPAVGAKPLLEAIGGDMSQMSASEFLDKVAKIAEQGEIRIYATDDGESVKSFVFCKNDSTVQLNGDTFGALIKIAELTEKLNELVAAYNSHGHSPLSSSLPDVQADQFDQTTYENTKVVHGEGR